MDVYSATLTKVELYYLDYVILFKKNLKHNNNNIFVFKL